MSWTIVAATLVTLFALAVLLKLYLKLTTGWDFSSTCLKGKTVIVTGSNSGIGYESAKEFAKRGARVIMACRNLEKAKAAREAIISETNNDDVIIKQLNLSSFDSVKRFAEDVNNTESRLDVLLNNRGTAFTRNVTEDGFEETMQVNYLSHCLLMFLLLDLLKQSAPSRIVNVSSLSAVAAIFVEAENFLNFRVSVRVYSTSKLCQIYFTQELAQKLKDSDVSVFSLHPGIANTKIYDTTRDFFGTLCKLVISIFFKNVVEGAQTQNFLCAANNLEHLSGEHFEDCRKISPYWTARDPEKGRRIWQKTLTVLEKVTKSELFSNVSN